MNTETTVSPLQAMMTIQHLWAVVLGIQMSYISRTNVDAFRVVIFAVPGRLYVHAVVSTYDIITDVQSSLSMED
jgi:hypothetical protein